ncbi:MAG: hypothetical protein ISF22_10275 [Methanomassiliicoccus sp.]|nr:hypothetical protein [Methanomassiliicoccus sp.]
MRIITLIAIALAALTIAAATCLVMLGPSSWVEAPTMTMGDATVESNTSLRASFIVVDEPRGISNYRVVVGVNDSSAALVRFGDDGKAIVSGLDDSTNSSQSTLLGVVFSVQFYDKDGDGRVSGWDYLIVTSSEPLRPGTRYVVNVVDPSGLSSTAICRT